jgi:hypothetical protein
MLGNNKGIRPDVDKLVDAAILIHKVPQDGSRQYMLDLAIPPICGKPAWGAIISLSPDEEAQETKRDLLRDAIRDCVLYALENLTASSRP